MNCHQCHSLFRQVLYLFFFVQAMFGHARNLYRHGELLYFNALNALEVSGKLRRQIVWVAVARAANCGFEPESKQNI